VARHMLGSLHAVVAFGQHVLFVVGVHWLAGNCSMPGTYNLFNLSQNVGPFILLQLDGVI